MTQDEVIEALRKVVHENQHYTTWTVSTPHLVLLVNLAVEKEREACAKLCWSQRKYWDAEACADAIRARGNHDTK
jgi:hypothetical protein